MAKRPSTFVTLKCFRVYGLDLLRLYGHAALACCHQHRQPVFQAEFDSPQKLPLLISEVYRRLRSRRLCSLQRSRVWRKDLGVSNSGFDNSVVPLSLSISLELMQAGCRSNERE